MVDSSDFVGYCFQDAAIAPAMEESTYRASAETIANIIRLVNSNIGRIARQWKLSADEVSDLRQEGYLAAIAADKTHDPTKAPWHIWIARRVNGQLKTSIARLRGYGITGDHGNIYPLSLDYFTPENHSVDNDDEETADPLTQVVGCTSQNTEAEAETATALEILSKCLDDAEVRILKARYGFDGPALTVTQLGERLGYSRKHAFTLLQGAENSARQCLGVRNS